MRPHLDVEGAAAPPRRNGELVFQEPWEGRAFGLAVALQNQGAYPWEAFRSRLIAAIAEADCRPPTTGPQKPMALQTSVMPQVPAATVKASATSQMPGAPRASATPRRSEYYDQWLTALRRLLVDSGILTPSEIEQRMAEFAAGERHIVNPGG